MPIPSVFHLTARLRAGVPSLVRPDVGPWLWRILRNTFPGALASCLMPDHPHLGVVGEAEELERKLVQVFRCFARTFGLGRAVADVSVTGPAEGATKVLRLTRYIALNPTRGGFVRDPLSWRWSTHRDVVGAVVDPWIDASRLAEAVGRPRDGFLAWYHRYVSGDPSTAVEGTPLPTASQPGLVARVPLSTILEAAASATRRSSTLVRQRGPVRTLFVQLAAEQGWMDRTQLAAIAGCTPRAIARLIATPRPDLLGPGRLCLGDERLRVALAGLNVQKPSIRGGQVTWRR